MRTTYNWNIPCIYKYTMYIPCIYHVYTIYQSGGDLAVIYVIHATWYIPCKYIFYCYDMQYTYSVYTYYVT